jgi:hypothetical protein
MCLRIGHPVAPQRPRFHAGRSRFGSTRTLRMRELLIRTPPSQGEATPWPVASTPTLRP